jgi:hypothetical protein
MDDFALTSDKNVPATSLMYASQRADEATSRTSLDRFWTGIDEHDRVSMQQIMAGF